MKTDEIALDRAKHTSTKRNGRFFASAIVDLAKTSVRNWMEDFAPSMGAALAYYAVFSIAPLLVIAVAVAGLVFGQDAVQHEVLAQLEALVGAEGARAVEGMLQGARKPEAGAIASVVSIVMLLVGATTVFGEIESDLNRIWRAPKDVTTGLWHWLRTRLLSLGLIISVGFLLLISLVLSAALAAFGKLWSPWFGDMKVLLAAANLFVSLLVYAVLFALMYKLLPRVSIAWRDVLIGAATTAVLFSIGKELIGLYLGRAGISSTYGAAGAVLILLIWVYYSGQIFLLGAEFTRAYAQRFGSWKNRREALG
jgi:membrane protein